MFGICWCYPWEIARNISLVISLDNIMEYKEIRVEDEMGGLCSTNGGEEECV
jgi:hypothetical protein